MKFVRAQGRFGAGRLRHGGAVGLTQLVWLDTVFIKEQQVDGVVNNDDAQVVHIARLQRAKPNDDALARVHLNRGLEGASCSSIAIGRRSSTLGHRSHRASDEQSHQHDGGHPAHGRGSP